MKTKKVIINLLILVFTFLTSISLYAQDRIFNYTYQSTVLNKGQREIEVWNTLRLGKDDFFARLDNRTEFEIGLSSRLQTAFYFNITSKTSTIETLGIKSLSTKNEVSFSNEFKLKLMDQVANPIGLALYGEYGIASNEFELEGKLIVDKKINDLTIAANAVYESEFKPKYSNNKFEFEKENKGEFYLAFGYKINPKFHITFENAFKNVYEEKELEHSALYSGLGFSFSNDNYWINFTIMPQVKSFKGHATSQNINLDEFEKLQIRLLFSYVL